MSNFNKIEDSSFNVGNSVSQNLASNIEGIFSTKPMAKYLSGARCTLRVNGKIIGFAFAISWDIRTSVTEINTIDDYMPYELAPQRIEVNGAISCFRIPGSGPTQQLMQTDTLNFLHQRYIEIEARDSNTDNLIFLAQRAIITSRTENIKIDSLADMTLSFKAIGWVDERTPNDPVGIGEAVDANGTNPLNALKNKIIDSLPLGPIA